MAHIWLVFVLTAALQFASHYLPWASFIGKRTLPRFVAYIIGVVTLLLPVSVWAWITGETIPAWALWVCAGSSGVGVGAGYLYDNYKAGQLRIQELKEQLEHRYSNDAQDELS